MSTRDRTSCANFYFLTKIIDLLSRFEHRVGNILLELLVKLPDLQTRFFDAVPGL